MNSEGIGMGLMICQKLVGLNHGEILVQSDGVDRGARFTFTMKMSKENDSNATAASATIMEEATSIQQANLKLASNDSSYSATRKQEEKEEEEPTTQVAV